MLLRNWLAIVMAMPRAQCPSQPAMMVTLSNHSAVFRRDALHEKYHATTSAMPGAGRLDTSPCRKKSCPERCATCRNWQLPSSGHVVGTRLDGSNPPE